jgi:hypothetical protein
MNPKTAPAPLAPPTTFRSARVLERLAAAVIVVAVAGFVALAVPAMRAYPGGTVWDPTTRGNDFWLNYLSDLQRTVAINGQPNPTGARYAQGAMLLLAVGLGPVWWLLARLFPERVGLGHAVRACGVVTMLAAVAAGFLPSDRYADGHTLAILGGGAAGVVAAGLATVGLAGRGPTERFATALGATTVAISVADFLLYVSRLTGAVVEIPPIAVLERISLLLMLAWMCAIARSGALGPRTRP